MKNLIFCLSLFFSTLSFAAFDGGVIKATLQANKKFDLTKLDQVGSTIRNSKTGDTLRNHCRKRKINGDCTEIIHILETDGKALVLHKANGMSVDQDTDGLNKRLDGRFLQSLQNFTNFDSGYQRAPGDFTGYVGMLCIYEPATCGLLLFLPVTIAADLVMLPIDLTIQYSGRVARRKKAVFLIESLKSDEDIELKNRSFRSLLKGLSQL